MVLNQGRRTALWVSWLLLSCGLTAADSTAAEGSDQAAAKASTRFFIDEGYFLEGDTDILRAYISASNGRMTISGESTAAFLSVKGYYSPEAWDVYWTIRQACHMAYKHMGPHQKVNCIPGISAMSLKRNFVLTWQKAYGERAFDHMPRSYLIPEQYWLWRSHLLASASPADRKWVLKANMHRGKGVSVVPQHEALSNALTHQHEPFSTSGSTDGDSEAYLNVLVQSYLQQQLVIAGRSSYIRVWLLVTSIQPLRAYLFDGGFAIFGKQKGPQPAAAAGAGGSMGGNNTASSSSSSTDDLIVNLWMQDRNSSSIWSLQHLRDYLNAHPESVLPLPDPEQQQQQQQQRPPAQKAGRLLLQASKGTNSSTTSSEGSRGGNSQQQQQQQRRTFADAWEDMQASASLVLAAALPAMRAAAAETGAPDQGTFEYFGLDFVFDAHLRPWMLEVNAIPSMARRKQSDCSGKAATASCKLTTAGLAAAAATPSRNSSSKGTSPAAAGGAAAVEDDFDAQKEQFVHDMLAVLGLPVDAPQSSSTSIPAASAAVTNNPSDAAGLLRMAAAAAAAAGIRSAAPALSGAQQSSSSSQAGVANATAPGSNSSGSSKSSGRLLLSSQPGHTAQQEMLSQAGQQHDEHQWWPWLHQGLQPRRQQQQRRQLLRQTRRYRQHRRPHHRPHHRPHGKQSSAANSTTISSSSSEGPVSSGGSSGSSSSSNGSSRQHIAGFNGMAGLQWSGPAPDIKQLPAPLQKLLCTAGSGSSSGSSGSSDGFACISCLTADDLAALAAAEGELQRAGRFVPVHDLITAHSMNQEALQEAAAASGSMSSAAGAAAVPGSATAAAAGVAGAAGTAAGGGEKGTDGASIAAAGLGLSGDGAGTHPPADSYLSENPSVWQKLYLAWKGMSQGHVGVQDLAVMKYYTTESQVHADTALRLQRVDYVMSAWLRVRREQGCDAGQQEVVSECVVKRLQLLLSTCYLQ